ncbi:xanthine dehydrogenase family protein molybdopterin-binding subunit [Halioglobus maricola]|uniref:Xanthine dehydrogenase family protein molybdopterin-binding subunit n=1 Tax=Halioglobus maricola TaxID=2601894 RepID=A0A5P9NNM9_9GAMM|nr:molybdopterin cofactor-binding domain-containing protein [Halioglobus maricola]QFU77269.1 xanthine dehydrogenase family protein molybdopterin-binding subunit [Halioglobus maricola]
MSLSRREFLRNASVVGGGLTLGFHLQGCANAQSEATELEPNAFLKITSGGDIIVQIHKTEMGQGTVTGMISLIAEELEVDPATVRYEMAHVDKAFRDPEYFLQITGGSNAIRVFYEPLRETGATALAMLMAAAVARSGFPEQELHAENGVIRTADGGVSLSYGELASDAASMPVPKQVTLKDPSRFKIIGADKGRLDNQPKVDGSANFGIDAGPADALVAVLVRPPVGHGEVTSFDATEAETMSGVKHIVKVDGGIAVVASNYWRARKAAEKVSMEWRPSESPLVDSAAIDKALSDALAGDEFATVREDGKAPTSGAARQIEVEYSAPFLAHATMEPMNATVAINGDSADIWVGTQAPDLVRSFAAKAIDIDDENITVHNQFLGGGFGRRAIPDHVFEAAQIARAVGEPIRLVWSREDDTRHDFYRPPMKTRFRARLGTDGEVLSWENWLAGPSLMQENVLNMSEGLIPGWVPDFLIEFGAGWAGKKDGSATEGLKELPYSFSHIYMAYQNVETPVRLGAWRSVGHSHNGFFAESFVDELAAAVEEDPIAFRRRHLPQGSRHRQVLDAVEKLSNWGKAPDGHFQGVAVHESFHSVVAEVVEISLRNGKPKLEKGFVAVHCGRAVNPDIVRQQMEGGMLFGLSAAMYGEITFEGGAAVQSNFHDYLTLRMNEVPEIEVAIIESDDPPTGVGEPGTPPAPAALGNAIFAATGQRLRDLPFKLA